MPVDQPVLTFIGRIRTPFADKAGCPRNVRIGAVEAVAEVDPPFREGLAGLAGISHVILLYWLDRSDRSLLTVTPPAHGTRRGVFSTRAPVRPNPVGIACVPVTALFADRVVVTGADCIDGTPLLDIKPYLPSVDAHPEAVTGWHAEG